MRQEHRAAVLLTFLVLLLACTGGPPQSGSPQLSSSAEPTSGTGSPTAEPTGEPTDEPSAEPSSASPSSPGEPTLAKDNIATVTVSTVRMRSAAGTGSNAKIVRNLARNDRVYILGGPASGSGFTWYLVQPLHKGSDSGFIPAGWVAAKSRTGQVWLRPLKVSCPASPTTLAKLTALQPEERLYCFGSGTVTFRGKFGGCSVSDPLVVKPEWLDAYSCIFQDRSTLRVHDNPPGDLLGNLSLGAWYEVTGHFDDPAARSCKWTNKKFAAPRPEAVILQCRTGLAVSDAARVAGP